MIVQNGETIVVDTLRARQIGAFASQYVKMCNEHLTAALKQLLNLNQPVSHSLAVEPVWKLLVLDSNGQDIISPLIPVKQLREMGVTLHLYVCSMKVFNRKT